MKMSFYQEITSKDTVLDGEFNAKMKINSIEYTFSFTMVSLLQTPPDRHPPFDLIPFFSPLL